MSPRQSIHFGIPVAVLLALLFTATACGESSSLGAGPPSPSFLPVDPSAGNDTSQPLLDIPATDAGGSSHTPGPGSSHHPDPTTATSGPQPTPPTTSAGKPRPIPDPDDPDIPNVTQDFERDFEAGGCAKVIERATRLIETPFPNRVVLAVASLYRALATGCVGGPVGAISVDLTRARGLQTHLVLDDAERERNRCIQLDLLNWAFSKYLGVEGAVSCPPRAPTTTSVFPTTSTTANR